MKVGPRLPAQYVTVGPAKGSACGFLLFNLFPIAVNSRANRAYDEAVRGAVAMGLTDTTVTDSWYYAGIGYVLCTAIEGTAIREASVAPAR